MNKLDRISSEIENLNTKEIKTLLARLDALYSARREEKSRLFIEVNNITKGCVQRHVGEGVPWHGDIHHFGEWLKTHSDKKWCEWWGTIYLTSEVVQGRMDINAVARYEDLLDE